jgi:type IV pilus assembly protein PilA
MAGKLGSRGMTMVEVMVVTAIVGVLAVVAIRTMRDYARRASISEVLLATGTCKQVVTENYTVRSDPPDAGTWGCESSGQKTKYAGTVQTSANGVIRISIANVDRLVNGQYIHLVPARSDGSPMVMPDNLGDSVKQWVCGSDWQPVRNSLPANCRIDTTTWSTQDFLP